tara:strand:- start:234 stop:914 length:681 start_codon:yes stop_codon:yes gene_type:complete
MDYEFELEKFDFKSKNELSSFSDACESRLRDRFNSFFHEVRQTGSSEENQNILLSAKVTVDNKPRRALDFAQIVVEPEQINIFSNNGQALAGIREFLKTEKGFTKFSDDPRMGKLIVKLPKLTFENKMELSNAIDGKYGTFLKNITGVKTQTGTQIKAGLTNEFIDGKEATKAGKEIDLILAHYRKWGRTFALCKQKLILARDFKLEKEEDIGLEKNIKQTLYLFQ